MSYQALYRVWRPQTFDELVGQPLIAETLKNAIQHQQLSHAYLLTGPRGTGKTSAAKILAKAVNCPHQTGGNPCNQCDHCRAITAGQLGDVIEIDAASNNGVEEIRDLRDKVRYAPSEAAYKVYIIDEVHMLTTGAFNALLKTLEEPPAQVLFVLATTEPHKIPATIISRTQRFDFGRISQQDLMKRMRYILDQDGIGYEEEALAVIARAANGGMRDSLSLLDQALSFSQSQVSLVSALEVTGSLSQLVYRDYLQAIWQEAGPEALALVQSSLNQGKQAARFVEELILFCRDLLLTFNTQENYTLLTEAELESLRPLGKGSFFYQLIERLNEVLNQMRFATQGDLFLEVATIQLAQKPLPSPAEERQETVKPDRRLLDRLQTLEAKVSQLEAQLVQAGSHPDPTSSTQPSRSPRQRPESLRQAYQLDTDHIYAVLNEATREDIQAFRAGWQGWLDSLAPQDRVRLNGAEPQAAGPQRLLVSFRHADFCGRVQQDQDFLEQVSRDLSRYFQRPIALAFVLQNEWGQVRQTYKVLRDQAGGPVPIQGPLTPPLDASSSVQTSPAPLQEAGAATAASREGLMDTPMEMSTETQDFFGLPIVEEPVEEAVPVADMFERPQEETPAVIRQALDLFGEDVVTIDYNQ